VLPLSVRARPLAIIDPGSRGARPLRSVDDARVPEHEKADGEGDTMERRRFIIGTGLAGCFPPWAQAAGMAVAKKPALPEKLGFGLISPRNADEMLKNWNPFFDRMSHALGIPIERQVYSGAGELVSDFVARRLDLGWLGNAAALDVVESGTGSVFATMVNQGKSSYRSVLITHRDSPLHNLEDVVRTGRQLRFGDGDEKSASGHIVPMYFAFLKKGVSEPARLFKEIRRGSHQANLQATVRKEVDVATNNTSEIENFRTANPDAAAQVRVIWESPEIPESPMVWRNDLPAAVKQKLAAFVYGFGAHDPQEKEILWNINKLTGWRKSTNRQLVTIADLEMFNARQRIMNDPKLTDAERVQRVEEVTRRGSKLELMLKATS
jgi:phosphonate transport system substrate-binding protein